MKNAFTMIELIFVIVIIGILAAIAIPKLSATRDDAKVSVLANNIKEIANELTAYAISQNVIKNNIRDMSNVLDSMIIQRYATQIDNSTINFKAGAISDCIILKKISGNGDVNITIDFNSNNTDNICKSLQRTIDTSRFPIPLRGARIKK